jgi:hypothetical protein
MSKTMNALVASRAGLAVMIAVAAAVVVGGVSYASVPDSNGVVHGCYKAQGASYPLSVINSSTHPNCPTGYKALKWDASPPGIGVGTGAATAGAASGSGCTLGEVSLFAQHGAYLPLNYVIASGELVSIKSYPTLFKLLGTTYGGDGKGTFALPKVQALAPDHMTYAICVSGVAP